MGTAAVPVRRYIRSVDTRVVYCSFARAWLDTRLGLREEELRNVSKSNPVMMEMLLSLKEIREKLDRLEKKGTDDQ